MKGTNAGSTRLERFEDLIAWQKARKLTRMIYQVSRQGVFAKDFGLGSQIQRASVSSAANIAEGFERAGHGEFEQFLSIAKASCAEVRSHLYIAFDVGYLEESLFRQLLAQAEEVGKIIGGLRASIEEQKRLERGKQ